MTADVPTTRAISDEAAIERVEREASRRYLGGNSAPTEQQRLGAARFVEGGKYALAQPSGRGADHAREVQHIREYEWFDGTAWRSLGPNPGVGERMVDNANYRTRVVTTTVSDTGWTRVADEVTGR